MDDESGDDDRDELTSEWGGESKHDWRGWCKGSGSWFQRRGDAYLNARSVIFIGTVGWVAEFCRFSRTSKLPKYLQTLISQYITLQNVSRTSFWFAQTHRQTDRHVENNTRFRYRGCLLLCTLPHDEVTVNKDFHKQTSRNFQENWSVQYMITIECVHCPSKCRHFLPKWN